MDSINLIHWPYSLKCANCRKSVVVDPTGKHFEMNMVYGCIAGFKKPDSYCNQFKQIKSQAIYVYRKDLHLNKQSLDIEKLTIYSVRSYTIDELINANAVIFVDDNGLVKLLSIT